MRDQVNLDANRCDSLDQAMQQVLERQELLTEDGQSGVFQKLRKCNCVHCRS